MSLADQSQQWFPTSVQVTVHQARSLRVKGKNGTNDAYAIIQVAKDKFSTSVSEKCVAPVWKEEASFDLPLFHPGNAERCTLYVVVMHRAQVGLDKFLGQAVVNLLDLHDNKSRKKTEWFKLVDKSGKQDKERGEVLLDIQFMRNNMSASMFDLSMQDKPRSRISKLKDKVRGKKKDGFSDSASAIVPSVSQVLTDSEGEADAQSLNQLPGTKKKSKLKTLFAPKSNLQRNVSQSMSTLGTLPEKNSSLSSSRSSGLNVDSPEVKKKFKLLGHKRTGSSDSKVSQGPFSLLGRSKQSNSDLNNLCINGSHVYTEETEPKSGSTLSLNSSGQGSVEDIRKHTSDLPADSFNAAPPPRASSDKVLMEQQRHQEEEDRRKAEEKRLAEAKRLEEEEKYRVEMKRLQEEEERRSQEEQERKRRFLEDEARRKKQKEEEEERRRQEQDRSILEAQENQKAEEERRKAEEQKRQEEASMSDRLSSLFGMIRKKEEKKEEVQQQTKEEQLPTPAPRLSHRSDNPFDDAPLRSDPPLSTKQSQEDPQKSSVKPQNPSAMVFLNRNAKVSAVKPRLALESEPTDCQNSDQLCPSPANSESTLSSVPSESPDTFSTLHTSLAPQNIRRSLSDSTENLSSGGSSSTMADQKKRAPFPPNYADKQTGGSHGHLREINNPAYVEADGSQQAINKSLPLPDYESLFPQKRHGVQGQTRWDHIIAEVNQRHRDVPVFLGQEMSVDGPVENEPSPRSYVSQESPRRQETKPVSSKKVAAPAPPKPVASPVPQPVVDSSQRQSHNTTHQSAMKTNPPSVSADASNRGISKDGVRKVLHPSPAATQESRQQSQMDMDRTPSDDQRKVPTTTEAPTAKPRQRVSQPTQQEGGQAKENFADFDPFPSTDLLPKDPWAQLKPNQGAKDNVTGKVQKEQKPEDRGMTVEDLDKIFAQEKMVDPFAGFSGSDANKYSQHRKVDDGSRQESPVFQRKNSQRGKKIFTPTTHSADKAFMSQQEPANKEGTSLPTANESFSSRDVSSQSQADLKTQSDFSEREDPFGAEPFVAHSASTSSQPLAVVMEEPASQAGSMSGGKTLLKAWVSPSDVQPVSTQNSSGGGLGLTPRRPHPVKPMSSAEIQQPISNPAVKEIRARDSAPGKIKVAEVGSGPYSQLTQEELITLVVKQQTDLSKKDAKITELEEYIDNLLVRVIEEQPSILHALNAAKPV